MPASTTTLWQSLGPNLPAKVRFAPRVDDVWHAERATQVLCLTDYLARTSTSWTKRDDSRRPRVSTLLHLNVRDPQATFHPAPSSRMPTERLALSCRLGKGESVHGRYASYPHMLLVLAPGSFVASRDAPCMNANIDTSLIPLRPSGLRCLTMDCALIDTLKVYGCVKVKARTFLLWM